MKKNTKKAGTRSPLDLDVKSLINQDVMAGFLASLSEEDLEMFGETPASRDDQLKKGN